MTFIVIIYLVQLAFARTLMNILCACLNGLYWFLDFRICCLFVCLFVCNAVYVFFQIVDQGSYCCCNACEACDFLGFVNGITSPRSKILEVDVVFGPVIIIMA